MIVTDLAPAIGARIKGVRVDRLRAGEFGEILRLLLERQVVCIEGDGNLAPDDQLAFARRLGPVQTYPFGKPVDGSLGVYRIVKEKDSTSNFGGVWHTDSPYHRIPPAYTVLRAVEIPRHGGDTLVASMQAAYDALPPATKERVANLDGIFTATKVHGSRRASRFPIGDVERIDNEARADQHFIHPLVPIHPLTGSKHLYLSACHMSGVIGMPAAEADKLIQKLSRHIIDERFCGRIRWSVGAVVVIDNRCAQHYALNDYHGQRREVHRVLVGGRTPPSRQPSSEQVLDAVSC